MAQGVMITNGSSGAGISGRHVLYAVLAFFGLIFIVNGVFLYFALESYTGVVSQEPYRKGLDYNKRIAADAAQKALGWTHALKMRTDGALEVTLVDKDGGPVPGLSVGLTIGRPSTNVHDQQLVLNEIGSGRYLGHIAAPERGAWIATIEAVRSLSNDERRTVYRSKERLWLKP